MTNFVIDKCGCRDALMPGKTLKVRFAKHLLVCELIRSAAQDACFYARRGSGTSNEVTTCICTYVYIYIYIYIYIYHQGIL